MPEKVLKVGDHVITYSDLNGDYCGDRVDGIIVSIGPDGYIIKVESLKMRSVPFRVRRTLGEIYV